MDNNKIIISTHWLFSINFEWRSRNRARCSELVVTIRRSVSEALATVIRIKKGKLL